VKAFVSWIRGLPMLARWVILGAVFAGVTGGIAGLVIGLFDYAPTAPIAAVEIGFPATLAGALIGLVAGVITTTAFRIRRHAVSSRTNHFQGHPRR
jgi:hypothetical protein